MPAADSNTDDNRKIRGVDLNCRLSEKEAKSIYYTLSSGKDVVYTWQL